MASRSTANCGTATDGQPPSFSSKNESVQAFSTSSMGRPVRLPVLEFAALGPKSVSKKQPIQHELLVSRGPPLKQLGDSFSTRVINLDLKQLSFTVVVDKTFHPQLPTAELSLHWPSARVEYQWPPVLRGMLERQQLQFGVDSVQPWYGFGQNCWRSRASQVSL